MSDRSESHALASAFLRDEALVEVAKVLESRMFASGDCRLVYEVLLDTWRRGQPITIPGITLSVEERGGKSAQAALKLLKLLPALVVPTDHAVSHAKLVRDGWAKRETARRLERLTKLLATREASAASVLEAGVDALLDVKAHMELRKRQIVTAAEVVEHIRSEYEHPEQVETGIPLFPWDKEEALPAMRRGRMLTVAGRTGAGKTAFGVLLSRYACENGLYVGYGSLEMSWMDLGNRLVSSFGVPYRDVESRRVSAPYIPKFQEALISVAAMHFDIIDEPSLRASDLAEEQRARRYDLIVLDHLHRMQLNVRPMETRQALEDEVRSFVTLAREQEVPVVLLSQLRRLDSTNKRPTLEDIRETEVINQESAGVIGLWIASPGQAVDDPRHDRVPANSHLAEAIVLKNRYGEANVTVPLFFNGTSVTFYPDRTTIGRRSSRDE